MKGLIKERVAAITLGCKLNYAETSTILEEFCSQGWQLSSLEDGAELIIIHTCAVTKLAEKKCRQKIRGIIRKNPESRIAVIGCYSQLSPEVLSAIKGIDVILGSNDKFNITFYNNISSSTISAPFVRVSPASMFKTIYPGYSLTSSVSKERTRAFLKIQDGCDYGCSYCTIPLARGSSRSLSPEHILERAHILASSGYREIVLTGVNVADYHFGEYLFFDLLRMLEAVSVNRIRISSIEPDIFRSDLISLVAGSDKIVPHFHLPLQSGSDRILGSMRRRYQTSLYRSKVLEAVESIADCAIGADVMVGYPGETEDDFLEMCRFIEELPLAFLHVFSCSIRPGTALACQVANQERDALPAQVIARRSRELSELGRQKEADFKARYIGTECMVLFEESKPPRNGKVQCSGYTRNYLRVVVESAGSRSDQLLTGNELPVMIEGMDVDLNLKGRLLS